MKFRRLGVMVSHRVSGPGSPRILAGPRAIFDSWRTFFTHYSPPRFSEYSLRDSVRVCQHSPPRFSEYSLRDSVRVCQHSGMTEALTLAVQEDILVGNGQTETLYTMF